MDKRQCIATADGDQGPLAIMQPWGDVTEREANADLIVRAVNSHAALVEVAELLLKGTNHDEPLPIAKARAALALARAAK
jgi:hypothetical protein